MARRLTTAGLSLSAAMKVKRLGYNQDRCTFDSLERRFTISEEQRVKTFTREMLSLSKHISEEQRVITFTREMLSLSKHEQVQVSRFVKEFRTPKLSKQSKPSKHTTESWKFTELVKSSAHWLNNNPVYILFGATASIVAVYERYFGKKKPTEEIKLIEAKQLKNAQDIKMLQAQMQEVKLQEAAKSG